MGKGACFDFYDNGVNCIRSIMACVCCMLCIGPILIIVGVVVLLAKNNFDDNVSTYKSAITTYQASSAWLMSQSSGNVTAGSSTASTLYVYNTTVLIVGTNADKLPSTYSISLQTNYPIDISMTRSATLIAPVSQLSTSAPASNVVNVPSSYQQDGCYSGNMDYCSGSCDTNCQDKYGKGAYADLTSNTRCKWCQYWIYSCLPLTRSTSNTWMVDNSIGSCDYVTLPNGTYTNAGFGQQPMTIVRNSLVANQHYVHFMANDDPYIVAQRLTKGTMDFGLTAAQQRVLGAVLLVIGILITISMLCVFVCLRNRMNKDPRNGAAFYGAFGRQYTPAQGVVMTPGTYGGVVYGPQSGYQTYDQPPPSAYPPQPYQQVQYQEGYQQGKGV